MLLYVAGKYKGYGDGQLVTEEMDKENNISLARDVAIKLWNMGFTVICPHLNTLDFEFDTHLENKDFVKRDLLIVERCDGIVMLPNWAESRGAVTELDHAAKHGLRIFFWPYCKEAMEK